MGRRFLLVLAVSAVLSAPAGALDCAAPEIEDRIVAIPARGEVLLESGATLRLAGVRLADAGPVGVAARAALDDLVGASVGVATTGSEPDRWGRLAGRITMPSQGDLAAWLVTEGLALVDPGADPVLCEPGLLDLELDARRARRGLWADATEHPLSAADVDALSAREGRFTLVEGVLRRVGERERRTYLDFGFAWEGGFTAVVSEEAWTALAAKGLDARALEGRRMRVRGILELWRGPALTIGSAEAIELFQATSAEPLRRRP